MDTATALNDIRSNDPERQGRAYEDLTAATSGPVDWSYDVWSELVDLLGDANNRTRAIAAQVLCNLAQSDPDRRMLHDLERLVEVTRDERFVTARHCLQSLWKVGAAGEAQRQQLVRALGQRFDECAAEKNSTLIRSDIIASLRRMYDATGDEALRSAAMEWMEREEDPRYRKKYAGLWKSAGGDGAARAG